MRLRARTKTTGAPLHANRLILIYAHSVGRMLVDCVRVIYADAYSSKHIGASLEEIFISFAVLIGTAEGRPMSATKVAGYLGMPRTNVLRGLAALKKKDIIYSIGYVYYKPRPARQTNHAVANEQTDQNYRSRLRGAHPTEIVHLGRLVRYGRYLHFVATIVTAMRMSAPHPQDQAGLPRHETTDLPLSKHGAFGVAVAWLAFYALAVANMIVSYFH